MALSVLDLITEIGVDNVCVQNLHESATRYEQRKNGDCAVTFLTNQASASDGVGRPRTFGLIVWISQDRIDEINRRLGCPHDDGPGAV